MDEGASWMSQLSGTDSASDTKTERVLLKFIPREAGTQKFEVHAELGEMEAVPQNNTKTFLLKVAPTKRVKILFVDGRPRAEFAAIKRALTNDPNIQLTDRVLTNVTDGKQYYFGTRTGTIDEFDFYPDDKEILFDFDAIILGNVDASQFTPSQLEHTVEFVRTRGGGLLMLGGSSSLGEPRTLWVLHQYAHCTMSPCRIGTWSPTTAISTEATQSIDRGFAVYRRQGL